MSRVFFKRGVKMKKRNKKPMKKPMKKGRGPYE